MSVKWHFPDPEMKTQYIYYISAGANYRS